MTSPVYLSRESFSKQDQGWSFRSVRRLRVRMGLVAGYVSMQISKFADLFPSLILDPCLTGVLWPGTICWPLWNVPIRLSLSMAYTTSSSMKILQCVPDIAGISGIVKSLFSPRPIVNSLWPSGIFTTMHPFELTSVIFNIVTVSFFFRVNREPESPS